MKKLTTLLIALLATLSSWGVKVNPEPAIITQADGTQLTVIGYGDEDDHWFTTTDGVLLAHVGYNYYVAAVDADGYLVPTAQLAHERHLRTAAELKLVAAQNLQRFAERATARKEASQRRRISIGTATPAYFPHEGSPRAMVILVEFPDTTFSVADPVASFNDFLNGEGQLPDRGLREDRNTGSVKQYFRDMSQGTFTPVFDVFGPVTTKKNWAYYGENPSSGGHDMSSRIQELIKEACEAIDDTVDFSAYDSNGDQKVDLVYVIYAGYGENTAGNSSYCIWPKSGANNSGTYDGVSVSRYGLNCELNYTPTRKLSQAPWKRINGIGLFCHEFSHTLGLPDMYPTVKSAMQVDNQTMEYWDLMDGGEYTDNSYTPTPYTPWEREVMGWINIDELTDTAQVVLAADECRRVKADGSDEYIILQNIQNEGWYSKVLGHGMLVYKVDYKKSSVNLGDFPNNTAGSPGLTLVPADGLLMSYFRICSKESLRSDSLPYTRTEYEDSHYGDPFPGTSGVTELLSAKLNKTTLEKPIYNIKEENGIISFDFLKDYSTLGIALNTAEAADDADSRIFTLDGRVITTDRNRLPKGVYIQNRQKFVVK